MPPKASAAVQASRRQVRPLRAAMHATRRAGWRVRQKHEVSWQTLAGSTGPRSVRRRCQETLTLP